MVREVKPSPEQINSLFQDKILTHNLTPNEQPQAIIFAGVSGSGKSTAIKRFYKYGNPNYFPIQADDYRRLHPKIMQFIEKYGREKAHKQTGNFSHRMAQALLAKATEQRLNVIYETTFNNLETATQLLDRFKQHQYQIIVLALPSNVELSIVRNQQRFAAKLDIEGTIPRIVDAEVIENMAKNYRHCLEQIDDGSIKIYRLNHIDEIFTLEI